MILIDMKNEILSSLTTECPWRDTLYWYTTIDSTNTQAKQMAKQGAPHGTVLIAGHQSGGRGRMGRAFQSPEGMGVYLSVILRPNCPPADLMHLTCAAGVAMMEAVEQISGIRPRMKWINDLIIGKRKLGGILTEMSVDKGLVEFAIIGIGINCLQKPEDFPAEIAAIATSLSQAAQHEIAPARLAAAMTDALYRMDKILFSEKDRLMRDYKASCITLGQEVQVIRGDVIQVGRAFDLDDAGGLWVEYPDGRTEVIASGEVSVRGMYGYL